jgi:3-methyladenine DNA glycosylase AlkD
MTGQADHGLVEQVRRELHAVADPDRAPQMQAYMKSDMPCLGVARPAVRSIARAAAKAHPFASSAALIDTARELWTEAEFRELRYAAVDLTGVPSAERFQTPNLVALYEQFISEGGWWDFVDEVTHRISVLTVAYPADLGPVLRRWSTDPDKWRRRAAVIGQLDAKERTNTRLLAECILANAADTDFFLRKAIGWALRQYARTDPDWVRAFISQYAGKLSPMSVREAGKHL